MYGNVTPSIILNNDGKLEAFSLLSDMKLYRNGRPHQVTVVYGNQVMSK